MKKTGILGGTFNPIHNGHLKLADTARDELSLDEVLLMPNGFSYFKADISMPDAVTRYEMTKEAVRDRQGLSVSDIETRRPGPSYTFETLEELKKLEPGTHFFYITGADTLLAMDTWMKPELIFKYCTVAVTGRKGSEGVEAEASRLENKYGAHIVFFEMDPVDISSSEIRRMISEGRDVSGMLPKGVFNFINDKGLYRTA